MSGYIQLSKDLLTDPLFIRLVRSYIIVTLGDPKISPTVIQKAKAETAMLGSLARLWMFADTHIREDNTLSVSVDEIDQLVGITNFHKLLPADWLHVIDPENVELPDFLEHNGTIARKKIKHAKAQANYRERLKSDHKRSRKGHASDVGRSPSHPIPIPSQPFPPEEVITPSNWENFQMIKRRYPEGLHRGDHWRNAEHHVSRLLDSGETFETLLGAVDEYRTQQEAVGRIGTDKVMRPSTFFEDEAWRGPFPLPAVNGSGSGRPAVHIRSVAELEAAQAAGTYVDA